MSRKPAYMLLALLAAALLAAAPAHAAGDAATTQSYLQADFRLTQNAVGHLGGAEAAINGVRDRVTHECPGAAARSPQNPQSTELSNELIGAMVISAIRTDLPPIRDYLRTVARLRWSNRGLNSAVHGYVAKLRTMSMLPVPDVCADIKSWAATGFTTLPASTVAFAPRFMDAWVALGEQPAALGRYESGEGRSLARRAGQRESEVSDFEAREVETWGHIMNTLQLNP